MGIDEAKNTPVVALVDVMIDMGTVVTYFCELHSRYPTIVPARIVWTRFSNSGCLMDGIRLTSFKGCGARQGRCRLSHAANG